MANFLKNLGAKVKNAAGRGLDLAGRGALYSQMMNDPSANITTGQRVGGAVSKGIIDATLGQMGTLGQALGAGLEARGRKSSSSDSPTGGGGVGATSIPSKQIKTENVIQAINQSTQQMLGGLNTLNTTFRLGLNATTNQMQAQASGISSLKRDTEDMVISLREIYEVLNKMGYQDRSKGNASGAAGSIIGDSVTPAGSSNSLLENILTGLIAEKLLGGMMPDPTGKDTKRTGRSPRGPRGGSILKGGWNALKRIGPKIGGGIGGLLGGLALDYGSDYAKESGYEKTGAGLSILSNVLSGAGAGGLAGSLFGGIGAIPGALIGGVGGLGYGLFNEGSQLLGMGENDFSSVPTAKTTGRTQSNVIAKEASSPTSSAPAYNPNKSRAEAIQNPAPVAKPNITNDVQIPEPVNPNKSRAEAIKNPSVPPKIANEPNVSNAPTYNPNKSRADVILEKQNAGKELTSQEIDKLFAAAAPNTSDEDLLALAQKMFPNRKFNTLKNRMQQLHMMMQPGPQSALESGVKVASAGAMSSGEYLASRQKMMDTQKDQTSESALRAKEQEYEQSVKDILQTIRYEARDVLFEADNIKFDASKIEFTEGGAGGSSAIGGGLTPGGGADNWRDGGTESRDGSGIGGGPAATKVPMSEETRKAAQQLQQSGSLTTLPGQDPLASYSDEQLQSLGVTRKEVRGAKGGREYSYTAPPKPKEGEGTFAKGASFEETSPLLMNRLMKDFDLTKEQAAGVIGNLAHESAGLVAGKQEINPVGGGRGGLGWAQWTGPRRKEFEAYLERTGQSADDPEANYGFLKEELMGSEKGALNKLKNASTVEEATVAFEQGYERAGIKHYGPRTDYARRAADLYDPKATGGVPSLTAGLQGMQPANAPQMANVDGKGVGAVNQLQAGKIRGQTLNEKTEAQLRYISQMAGVEMDVISGEQMDLQQAIAMGARQVGKQWVLPNGKVVRTGSTRHDESTGAADVKFKDPTTGKYIDISTPEGQAKASEIVKYATQAGMTGFGFGEEYMGRETMHLGGGKEGSWRTTASGGGTVDWIEAAREAGKKEQPVDAVAWVKQQEEKMLAAGKLNVEEASAKNLPPTSPLAMTPEKKARIQQRQRDAAFTQQMNSREGVMPAITVAQQSLPTPSVTTPQQVSAANPLTNKEAETASRSMTNPTQRPYDVNNQGQGQLQVNTQLGGSANFGNKMAAHPQIDPAVVQASQKVSELSKKTTMNRETAPYKQGPVTVNNVSNNKATTDTTGLDAYDKNNPNPAITSTMDKYIAMYYGGGNQSAFA